jgi:hypothetical protein
MSSFDDELHTTHKLEKVISLRRTQWIVLKERDDRVQQIRAFSNDITVQVFGVVIRALIDQHLAHAEELMQLVKTIDAFGALRHRELV